MKNLQKSQTGIAHIGAILLIALVVVGIGGAGYKVYSSNQSTDDTSIIDSSSDNQSADDSSNPDDSPENDQVQVED